MPLTTPQIDGRTYKEIRDEMVRRIRVHNPEWTNFNESDPGITLIELFSFMTESLLYRCNQIPERMRRKFLSLLGIPLKGASPARGIISMVNERAPVEVLELPKDFEVRSGSVPFLFSHGMTLLPVEGYAFYKKKVHNYDQTLKNHYEQLYRSFKEQDPDANLSFYESVPFPSVSGNPVDIAEEAVDASLWIALVAHTAGEVELTRKSIAGKGLFFGLVPAVDVKGMDVIPGGAANKETLIDLKFDHPVVKVLPVDDASKRAPSYKLLETRTIISTDGLTKPGIQELILPTEPEEMRLWDDLDPLEAGTGDFPPSLEDTKLEDRIITWIRVRFQGGIHARLLWVGINAAEVEQRVKVPSEIFSDMSGEPDQTITLSHQSIIGSTVKLSVTPKAGPKEEWKSVDDLSAAGPEVPIEDMSRSPGVIDNRSTVEARVFSIDEEAGVIKFGNGFQGVRPQVGSQVRVSYDYSLGAAGNVGKGTINSSPLLPGGFRIDNPVRTWGGASQQSVADGEQQIPGFIRHQERMITDDDFKVIVRQTPGVDVGRVEVLSAYNPALLPNEPGDAPGAVTLMVLPAHDPRYPESPEPDAFFCKTICNHAAERRLITTELYIRGAQYKPVWISIGIDVTAGIPVSSGDICERVKREVKQFLSALPSDTGIVSPWISPEFANGWPLRKPVTVLQLMTVVARVNGVSTVNKVLLADADTPEDTIQGIAESAMTGLQLPRIAGISVSAGEPVALADLRGKLGMGAGGASGGGASGGEDLKSYVPIPIVQESCKPWM